MARATPSANAHPSRSQRKPFQPAIGQEFDGVREAETKDRSFLVRLFAVATVIGVMVAGGYSLIVGDFTAVIGAWSVAGPIIGALVAHYFGPKRDTG